MKVKRSPYADYRDKIQAACQKARVRLERIGAVGPRDTYPVYRVVLNSRNRRGAVVFVGGVHGDETSGPWAILKFLERYRPRSGHPKIILLPVVNPWGFEHGKRWNGSRVNLNRHFLDTRPPLEAACARESLRGEKVAFVATLHEDDVKNGVYLYRYSRRKESGEIYERILAAMARHIPVCRDTRLYGEPMKNGIVWSPKSVGALEEWCLKQGVPRSVCLEVPDSVSRERRVRAFTSAMEEIISFFE